MKKQEFLQNISDLLKNTNPEILKLSMNDVHSKGLFSLVIGGTEFGNLTRVFIADEKLKPFQVQLHTHRYPIRLTTIKGNIQHFVAFRSELIDCHTVELSEFDYKSPLNGGKGLSYLKETNVIIKDYNLPIGSTLQMTASEFHTVACSKGSIWIVEEQGFEVESSKVLGVPFITEELYNEPKSFQINDKHQLVKKEITKLLIDYQSV
jgi:hypothetical protein